MSFNKLILVPTDFSEKSESTYRYACDIASKTGAGLLFVHVIDEPFDFAVRVDEIIDSKKKHTSEHLKELISELKSVEEYSEISMDSEILVGKVRIALLEFIREKSPDLVVVGAKGSTSGIRSVLYGTVTSRLLIDSPVPVLTIPKHIRFRALKKIMFASDLREKDIRKIRKVSGLARNFDIPIHVVHVAILEDFDENIRYKGFKKLVKNDNKKTNLKVKLIKSPTFFEGISDHLGKNKSSMLVIVRYKKNLLKWLFSSHNASDIIQYSSAPTLMIPG